MLNSKKLVRIIFGVLMLTAVFLASFLLWKNLIVKEGLHRRTSFIMNTYFTIQAFGTEKTVGKAANLAFNRIQELDTKLNIHNRSSLLYKFNRENIAISDRDVIDIVATALKVSRESSGLFDITITPLMRLWRLYKEDPDSPEPAENEMRVIPDPRSIREALAKTGYRNLVIKDGRLTKTKDFIQIDLGGIAKCFALKEAGRIMRENGVSSALIDAGGDILAIGNYLGKPWKVGIKNPRGEDTVGILEVEDLAVITSGDYERFFIKDGVRYHHIMNPRTGYPASGLASVTVISEDPVLATVWAKVIFIEGARKGLEIVERSKKSEAIMITPGGEISCSSGLKNSLQIKKVRVENSTEALK
jgi:thiamine biosynthesis lipoprotein